MKSSNKYKIYQIATSGLLIALSIVLGIISKFVPFFRMPSGGGISLAMIPLTFSGLILGPIYGLVCGLAYSIFNMLIDGAFSWGLPSILLDYFLSYSSAAICGLFRKYFYQKKAWSIIVSLTLFTSLRFICHFFSGVLLFNPYFEETNKLFTLQAVSYSTIYNLGYLLPTLIVALFISLILSQPIFRLFNNSVFQVLGSKYSEEKEGKHNKENFLFYTSIISFICVLLSFVFKVTLNDISVNFGFFAIISVIISSLLFVYLTYLFINSEDQYYQVNIFNNKFTFSSFAIYFLCIIINIIIITLSILSICLSYSPN